MIEINVCSLIIGFVLGMFFGMGIDLMSDNSK